MSPIEEQANAIDVGENRIYFSVFEAICVRDCVQGVRFGGALQHVRPKCPE